MDCERVSAEMPVVPDDVLISVVVPIFNMQDYLCQCLGSICAQSYRNLDVILVDDGSTDDSAKICMSFCEKDSRFRLLRQENTGLGPARNTGIDAAQGKYICFIDADDYIHPDYIRILFDNLIMYKADISICRYKRVYDKGFDQSVIQNAEDENIVLLMDRIGLLEALLKTAPAETIVAWNKLVSTDWLAGFRFEAKWHEDEFMINEYILRCNRAVLTSSELYYYRSRPESIAGAMHGADLRHIGALEAQEQRIAYFYIPEYRSAWKDLLQCYLLDKIYWYRKLSNKDNAKMLKKIIYPRYVWGFFQYLRRGGLFRKNSFAIPLFEFFLSPKFYVCRWSQRKSRPQNGKL